MASFNQNGPQFNWPQTTEQNQDDNQTNQILTSIKNVIAEFANDQTETTEAAPTSGDFQNTSDHQFSLFTNAPDVMKEVFTSNIDPVTTTISATTITDAVTTELPETSAAGIMNDIIKNNTTDLVVDPISHEMGASNSTSITEMVQSNATTVVTNVTNSTIDTVITEMMESNSTTQAIGSNSTILTEMAQGNSTMMESGGGSILTQMGQNDSVAATIESATASVSEVITKAVTNATEAVTEAFDHNNESDLNTIEDKTLYIVVGTILVFLIILLVVLLVIYKRYKANGWVRSRSYHVANFSGVSVDSQKVCS